jgi:ADP-heptose:LPS heptosyltransferase
LTGLPARALLVILPHNPGDVIMALQAIRRIKARFGDLEVDYLVSEECRELVQGSPLLRKVLAIPKRALKQAWNAGDSHGLDATLEAFLRELASTRYALSANLFQERSGGLLQSFVDAGAKIGLELVDDRNFQVKSRFLEHLFAIPAHRAGNPWHVVDIYVRAIARALESLPAADASDRSSRPIPPVFPSTSAPRRPGRNRAANAAAILPPLIRPEAARRLVPGEYRSFHPGSAWPGKRWPESHWADLASRCAESGMPIAFTGAPEERGLMDRILARIRERTAPSALPLLIDCVGTTTLAGAAWICGHARLVVTGDTVAMHLAAAAGAPTLCLFGASNPVETGPYGNGHVIVQTDADPLPDLALDRDHPGLAHLRADEVAEYLLEGIPPPGFAMWETGWDEEQAMQVLRDRKRLPHPALEQALRLARVLDNRAAGTDRTGASGLKPVPNPDGPLGALSRRLAECLANPMAGNLTALEAAERDWAQESQASLVWEAYRIAINGLPLNDLRSHLSSRFARFEAALGEAASSRRDSGPLPAAGVA